MTTIPLSPDLEAARALREGLLPVIYEVTVYPVDQKELRDAFPLGLVKLPPWLRDGIEGPGDIAFSHQRPAALFALTRMRLGLEIADEYNIAHNARHQGSSPPKEDRGSAYQRYRARLKVAVLEDERLASARTEFLNRLTTEKLDKGDPARARQVTEPKFRELMESADILLRAAAYEDARRRLSLGRNWATVTDVEREVIVADVLARLYTDTCRTFWGTPADDPEHPAPLREDLSASLLRALMRAEVGRISFEGTGWHLPRNWWAVKVERRADALIHHKGHNGTHQPTPRTPYLTRISLSLMPRVDKSGTIPNQMLADDVFTIGARRRVMEGVRAYSRKSGRDGAEDVPPDAWQRVNTTSKANAGHWGRAFSPMLVGPVPLYDGMTSRTLEAAWQFSKVYRERAVQFCKRHQAPRGPACRAERCTGFTKLIEPVDHIGADGLPNENWWAWARSGWEYEIDPDDPDSREYLRRPMGSGVKAIYSYWEGRRHSYVEGRRQIYMPLYAEAAKKLPVWTKLKGMYDAGEGIRLYDVDGRNLYNLDMTYEQALNDPAHPFGHSLVLCALLEGVDLSALQVWDCNRLDEAAMARRLVSEPGMPAPSGHENAVSPRKTLKATTPTVTAPTYIRPPLRALGDGTFAAADLPIPHRVYCGAAVRLLTVNRALAARVVMDEPYMIISIDSPGKDVPALAVSPLCVGVLRVLFNDIRKPRKGRLLFERSHAREILDFVGRHLPQARAIIVHCTHGIFRSPAVAAALSHILQGEERFFQAFHTRNSHVYNTLLTEWRSNPKPAQLCDATAIHEPQEDDQIVTVADAAITLFRRPHAYLSNFRKSPVVYEGITYPTVEHAYQVAKTLDKEWREKVLAMRRADYAKQLSARRAFPMRPDWHQIKVGVMLGLLRQKFSDPKRVALLLGTGTRLLIEGNWWGDEYWGMCEGDEGEWRGENHLGRLLMQVRDELVGGEDPYPQWLVSLLRADGQNVGQVEVAEGEDVF